MEVIEHIVSLEPSIIVLDYWANPTIARYRDTLPRILSYLASELPETDILVLGTFYNPGRDKEHAQKDKIATFESIEIQVYDVVFSKKEKKVKPKLLRKMGHKK